MEDFNWKMLIVPVLILFVFIGGIIGIVNWQNSKKVPQVGMSVNLPEGEVQSAAKDVVVSGKAAKGDKVFVNDEEVKVENDETFTKTVSLNDGSNKITIKQERNGKEVQSVERTVIYTAPVAQPPATNTQPATTPVAPSSAPAVVNPQTAGNLSTSGPEEIVIPVVGFSGIVLATVYYIRSRKKLHTSMRK